MTLKKGTKPKGGRTTTHVDEDTLPHGMCLDPARCDCECVACMRAWHAHKDAKRQPAPAFVSVRDGRCAGCGALPLPINGDGRCLQCSIRGLVGDWAFFHISAFPLIAGGEIVRVGEPGFVQVRGRGSYCKPAFILDRVKGPEIASVLAALAEDLKRSHRTLDMSFAQAVNGLIRGCGHAEVYDREGQPL